MVGDPFLEYFAPTEAERALSRETGAGATVRLYAPSRRPR
jgi:hypothetical protein